MIMVCECSSVTVKAYINIYVRIDTYIYSFVFFFFQNEHWGATYKHINVYLNRGKLGRGHFFVVVVLYHDHGRCCESSSP